MRDEIIAGDSLTFYTSVPDYPASGGWDLTYKITPRVSGTAYSFDASEAEDGERYLIEVPAATTAEWVAGTYTWTAYVSKAGERHVVDGGELIIRPDPAEATSLDRRSHARKVLDAIEALLEDRATSDQKRIVIRDRELERFPVADLVKLRQAYRLEVISEDNAARISAGLAPRNRIYVRR